MTRHEHLLLKKYWSHIIQDPKSIVGMDIGKGQIGTANTIIVNRVRRSEIVLTT